MSNKNRDHRGPYFFLAYAHTPEQAWIARLYGELSNQIWERTDCPTDQPAGFMDQTGIRHGADWRSSIDGALASCRVFVPLYSPRYFTRPECGREWNAFASRVLLRGGASAPIVPALWTPVEDRHLPPVARRIQADFRSVNAAYAEEGLYTLIKNRAYRSTYLRVVERLAKQIIVTAENAGIGPCDAAELDLSSNAFTLDAPMGEAGQDIVPANRRLTIMVGTPVASATTGHRQTDDRQDAGYDEEVFGWRPFAPRSSQVLAEVAAELARSHDLVPTTVTLEEGLSLDWQRPETGMGVVLLDPWLTLDAHANDLLGQVDELCAGGRIGAVVLWNSMDQQTLRRTDELRRGLQGKAPRCLGDPNVPVALGACHVHSLEQFTQEYPAVLDRAFNRYLNQAAANPPSGDSGPLPSLWGGDGDPTSIPAERLINHPVQPPGVAPLRAETGGPDGR